MYIPDLAMMTRLPVPSCDALIALWPGASRHLLHMYIDPYSWTERCDYTRSIERET